jgi:hypothetical protein
MAVQTTTTADAILKDNYIGPVETIINESHPLLNETEQDQTKFTGKRVVFPVKVARNNGAGARNTSLPTAGYVATEDSIITAKRLFSRFEIEDTLISAASNDRGSFVEAVTMEMDGAIESLKYDINRQLYGNKLTSNTNTGPITQVNGVVSNTTTIVLDDNHNIEPGQTLVVGTSAELTGTGTPVLLTVATVSDDGVTITSSANVTLADDDIVVRGDGTAVANHGYTNEINGLSYIVNDEDDNFQSVDTGNYPGWAGVVNDNGGTLRNLELRLMFATCDLVKRKSGFAPNKVIMHDSMRREYTDLLVQDVRYQPQKLEGGVEKLTFAGFDRPIDIFTDRQCTLGAIYFLNMKYIKQFTLQPWGWMDKDGAVLSRVVDKPNYEATFRKYFNLGTRMRNSAGVLKDLNYSLNA